MEKKEASIFFWGCLVGFILGMHLISGERRAESEEGFLTEKKDTTTTIDSLRIIKPEAKAEGYVGSIKAKLKIASSLGSSSALFTSDKPAAQEANGDSLATLGTQSMQLGDSVEVEIPITQKEYSDSNYRAWVSGYKPRLDSIEIYSRREMVTITRTAIQKPKRWGIGISAGYGFGKNGWGPYIGVGINYNLWGF